MRKTGIVLLLAAFLLLAILPAWAGEIHKAIEEGNAGKVKSLLEAHPEWLNAGEKEKLPAPLPFALAKQQKEIALFLIEKGADVNSPVGQYSPLCMAAALGWNDVAEALTAKGAVVNVQDMKMKNPLHCAVQYRHKSMVAFLLGKGADVNQKNGEAQATPLHYTRDADITKMLLDKGADVNAKTVTGPTPLYTNLSGQISVENVKLLVDRGAEVNIKDQEGRTPLFLAAFNDKADLVKYLVEKGAKVNVKDNRGNTPLFEAVSSYYSDAETLPVVKVLLEKGADPNTVNAAGDAPLHLAALMDKAEVVKTLVQKGAKIDVKGNSGETALHMAAREGKITVAKALLDSGAPVNAVTTEGKTPLHLAAAAGSAPLVELLISRGADAKIKDKTGAIALQYAEALGEKGRIAADILKKQGEK